MSEQEQAKDGFVEGFTEGMQGPPPGKWVFASLFAIPAGILSFMANMVAGDLINDGFQNRTAEALGKTGAAAKKAAEGVGDYLKKARGRGRWVAGIGLAAMAGSAIYGWFKGKEAHEAWDKERQTAAKMTVAMPEMGVAVQQVITPAGWHVEAAPAVTEAAPAGRVQEASAQQAAALL